MTSSHSSKNNMRQDRSAVATINAALLGILIAFVTAYTLYHKSVLHERETEVIAEAGRINNVLFTRSSYFPEEGFGEWADNVNKSILAERKKLLIQRAHEPKVTKLSPPRTAEDIRELGRYLIFLADPFGANKTPDNQFSIGNEKYIPRDLANRGEEILRVLNIFTVCYLFPEPPFETPGAFSRELQTRIYFKNIDDVQAWLSDLETFVLTINKFKYIKHLVTETKYIDQLRSRDVKLIEKWESSRLLRTFGHLDPDRLIEDFFENFDKAQNVAESSRYALNRIEHLNSSLPAKRMFSYIFVVVLPILFLLGVFAPLAFPATPNWLYLHIPILSYVCLYLFVILSVAS